MQTGITGTTMATANEQNLDDYQVFQLALQDTLGIVIGDESRILIEGRLQPIMIRESLNRLADLARAVKTESPAHIRSDVLDAITTHDTQWFGHDNIHRLLAAYVIPSLIDKGAKRCSIWHPGCGHGQSTWSLAMALDTLMASDDSGLMVEIHATDSSADAVEHAQRGVYGAADIEHIPTDLASRYLVESEGAWHINEDLRQRVNFRTCDLLSQAGEMGLQDVIISPDILMYFSVGLKKQILDDYANLLEPNGILILNDNESVLPMSERFERVDHDIATFYRQVR